jgi:oligopeptidase B
METPLRMNTPIAPIAIKSNTELNEHGKTRIDPYFWMRLSDEQKNADQPDQQTQQVLEYLNKENEYTQQVMAHTNEFQQQLFDEIVGRIKQDDESVPYLSNGYWYYIRYEEGGEYPLYCRKQGSLEADEEVYLNINEMAEGHAFYAAYPAGITLDNKLLAIAEDTVSRNIFKLRFKNLETGEFLTDEIENTTGNVAWANDNKTFFYTTKNKVSLLSEKIFRHTLGQSQTDDVMVYQEQDPSFYIGVTKSKSKQFIVIYNSSTLVTDFHILDANDPMGEFKQFIPRDSQAHEYSISHFKDQFYILTNRDAKNFKLMVVD